MARSILLTIILLTAELSGAEADLLQTAETVLVYQRESGGWPKNYDREERLTEARRKEIIADRQQLDSTIDNGATHREIRILASSFAQSGDEKYRKAALRGIQFLIDAQKWKRWLKEAGEDSSTGPSQQMSKNEVLIHQYEQLVVHYGFIPALPVIYF